MDEQSEQLNSEQVMMTQVPPPKEIYLAKSPITPTVEESINNSTIGMPDDRH